MNDAEDLFAPSETVIKNPNAYGGLSNRDGGLDSLRERVETGESDRVEKNAFEKTGGSVSSNKKKNMFSKKRTSSNADAALVSNSKNKKTEQMNDSKMSLEDAEHDIRFSQMPKDADLFAPSQSSVQRPTTKKKRTLSDAFMN